MSDVKRYHAPGLDCMYRDDKDAPRELIPMVLATDYDALHAEAEALRGLTPELPPRPPEGAGLPRYGLRWNGPAQPLSVPMDDGYWTPWHLAEALLAENGRLQADRDRANQYANQQALECNKLSTDLEAARGLLESAVVLFACHCTDATAKNWHDAAAAFLTATPAPEVQASGPYASVAGALAQRYPKPSLLKDCNVSYSNSSRPLAEQGERQEASQDVRALVRALLNGGGA